MEYLICNSGSKFMQQFHIRFIRASFGKLFGEGVLRREGPCGNGVKSMQRKLVSQLQQGVVIAPVSEGDNRYGQSPISLEQRLDRIDAVTEDDVMRVAGDILREDALNVVVLGKGNREIKGFDLSSLAF